MDPLKSGMVAIFFSVFGTKTPIDPNNTRIYFQKYMGAVPNFKVSTIIFLPLMQMALRELNSLGSNWC